MIARMTAMTSFLALSAGMAHAEMTFNRIASFATPANMAQGEDASRETSAEIISATPDGRTLVYTDSPLGVIGLIDIADPSSPKPLGNIDMGGEPTSVGIIGGTAYVAVNTSESYTQPSGKLVMVDIAGKAVKGSCDLGGQPDSVAVARDGSFLSIAVENERDEDAGDGRVPQMPAGDLVMVPVSGGVADCSSVRHVAMTGLSDIAPEDPEPEFVDINSRGETVVTLQENNTLVIVDKTGKIEASFSAGTASLDGVDTEEEGALTFDGQLANLPREPDAVGWIDDDHFAIANEGDMDGGTRGWSIFSRDGTMVYDSGLSFEYAAAEIGHYPEKRSGNKGVEPESIEFARYGETPLVFVGAERASVIGVYDVSDPENPQLKQMLPSGISPEGIIAIPSRNLLVTANEVDLGEDGGARAHVMIYAYEDAPARYPMLTSAGFSEENHPVGWGALSGLVADGDHLWAVNDSFYKGQPSIFRIDPSARPARIDGVVRVTMNGKPAEGLDLEGITTDGQGGFWLANEGNPEKGIAHAILHVDASGKIMDKIQVPEQEVKVSTRFGFEGIARVGDTLWMPVQREWGDDPKNHVKIMAYNTKSGEWGAVAYEKAAADTGWTGLSELTIHGDRAYVVERDNQIGEAARLKKIYSIPLAELSPAPLGGELPVVHKTEVLDLMPELLSTGGYAVDKVEGLGIMEDGTAYVVTDNDGVDDSSGETMFFSIGKL